MVEHLQCTTWPDMDAPAETSVLLQLIGRVFDSYSSSVRTQYQDWLIASSFISPKAWINKLLECDNLTKKTGF